VEPRLVEEMKDKRFPIVPLIILSIIVVASIAVFLIPFPYAASERYSEEVPYQVEVPYTEQQAYQDVEYRTEQEAYQTTQCTQDYSGDNLIPGMIGGLISAIGGGNFEDGFNKCNPVTAYKNVVRSFPVTKYRDVVKYRTETRFKNMERTRPVTKYATLFDQWRNSA
jgi:hypothetical protein